MSPVFAMSRILFIRKIYINLYKIKQRQFHCLSLFPNYILAIAFHIKVNIYIYKCLCVCKIVGNVGKSESQTVPAMFKLVFVKARSCPHFSNTSPVILQQFVSYSFQFRHGSFPWFLKCSQLFFYQHAHQKYIKLPQKQL